MSTSRKINITNSTEIGTVFDVKPRGIFTVKKYFEGGEATRGIFTSLATLLISYSLLNYFHKARGWEHEDAHSVFVIVFGSILGYGLDILFAKEKFVIIGKTGNKPQKVNYSDFNTRFKWLRNSYTQKYFVRFMITVFIDSIISLTMTEYIINRFNEEEFMMDKQDIRNIAITIIVMTFTFFLYVNPLRFEWAYKYKEQPVMNAK